MRSWAGPVAIGLALGFGFAVANKSDEPVSPAVAAGGTADDRHAAAQPSPTADHKPAGPASTASPESVAASVRAVTATGPSSGVAITFDDGPHGAYTPRILEILDRHNAVAVFCVVGQMVNEHADLVQRIVDEGHALCNHTFTHDSRLSQRPTSRIADEVKRTRKAIHAAAPGAPIPYFRQPTIFVTDEVGAVTDALGYQRLDWTLDTKDWTTPGADAIRRVVQQLRPGAIILLHDGGGDRTDTVAALPRILDAIAAAGLRVGLPG